MTDDQRVSPSSKTSFPSPEVLLPDLVMGTPCPCWSVAVGRTASLLLLVASLCELLALFDRLLPSHLDSQVVFLSLAVVHSKSWLLPFSLPCHQRIYSNAV